jgi:L-malate glycosyltransferase
MHLLVIPSYYPNSYNPIDGIYFKVQVEALKKFGIKVGVVAPIIIKHYVLKRERKIDFGYKIDISGIPTLMYQFPSFPVFKKVNDWLRLHYGKKLFRQYINEYGKPDLIHLHSYENGMLTRWIKKKYNIDFVMTEHSTGFFRNAFTKWKLKLARKAFEESNQVIVVSPDLQQTLKEKFGIECKVVPNLIDTEFFKPQDKVKIYDFITIGGLRPVKNFSLLIEAFAKLNSKIPNSKLGIIGVGPLKTKLHGQINQKGLENNIILLGHKSQTEIAELLNQSKIFVSSSQIETFGVAIIEAMSCGIPAIATRSGGPEYFITKDTVGTLCDHNTKGIANAMTEMLQDIDTYNADEIRNHIVNQFSSTVVCGTLSAIYKDAIVA